MTPTDGRARVRAKKTPLTGRAALLATLTEKQWQAQVIEWAHRANWRVFHVYDMVRSAGGWPDLVLVKPGKAVIYAELKTTTGRVSEQQKAWLNDLTLAAGTTVRVWRPTDELEVKRWLGISPLFAAGRSEAAEDGLNDDQAPASALAAFNQRRRQARQELVA